MELRRSIMKLMKNLKDEAVGVARMTKKLAEDDPRRIIHSLKVGLALTLVSLFYYFQTLYASFGVSALWAVMTVVVVFEFSVGATLGKGLNRALATILAGVLGVGAHHLAVLSGKTGEPIILGIFVFLQAAITTFVRFFPKIKARYDYGMLIFILTFCLVSISGFRTDEIIELAHKRLSTIMIGAAACVIVAIVVCPVWAGEDLQNLVVLNIEKLATFLEGFGKEYFKRAEEEQVKDNKASKMVGYKSVLNSKSTEETLANFARWEPGHGKFMYCHPWNQYLKVGALTRQCAYRIEALHDFLNSDIQMPEEIRIQIQDIFTETALNSGIVLREVALAIKTMTTLQPSENSSITIAKIAAENLKSLLKSDIWKNIEFMQVMQVATLASVLIDVVNCVEKITESAHELASLARFKSVKLQRKSDETKSSIVAVVPVEIDCPEVVINVKE